MHIQGVGNKKKKSNNSGTRLANWPEQQRGTRGVYVTSSLLNHFAEFEFFICAAVVVAVVVGAFQRLLKVCTHVFSFIQQEQQQHQ